MQRVIVKIDNDSDETMSRSHGDNDYEYDVANRKPPHRLGRGLTQNIQYTNSVNIQNAIKTSGERVRNKASRYGGDVYLVCNTRGAKVRTELMECEVRRSRSRCLERITVEEGRSSAQP